MTYYDSDDIEAFLENDMISSEEAGFMSGYLEA